MNTALTAIALADDVTVIRAFEYFERQMADSLKRAGIPYDQLIGPARTNAALRDIVDLARVQGDEYVSDADAVTATRAILVAAASDPTFERFVEHCIANWPEERLAVGKSVKLGLIAASLLIVATTEVRYENGSLSVFKRAVIPSNVEIVSQQVQSSASFRVKLEQPTTLDADVKRDSPAIQPPAEGP